MPVVIEGLAFGESGDERGEKCYAKEPVGELNQEGVARLIDVVGYAFEVEDNGKFAHPETRNEVLATVLE